MATATASVTTDEILTMDEIKKRFDSEWVLVAYPEEDENFNVLSGKVVCHNKDGKVFNEEVLKLDPFPVDSAFLYLGERPKNIITRFFLGFQVGK